MLCIPPLSKQALHRQVPSGKCTYALLEKTEITITFCRHCSDCVQQTTTFFVIRFRWGTICTLSVGENTKKRCSHSGINTLFTKDLMCERRSALTKAHYFITI